MISETVLQQDRAPVPALGTSLHDMDRLAHGTGTNRLFGSENSLHDDTLDLPQKYSSCECGTICLNSRPSQGDLFNARLAQG